MTQPPADAPAPEACSSMADVRRGVDAIDRELVRLLRARQGYMSAAARIKPEYDQVRDEARIAEVLSKVKSAAEASGLSTEIALPVWRLLIESCIAFEEAAWLDMRRDVKRA